MAAIDDQISGNHYTTYKIQPVEFIESNNIGFLEGCAIEKLARHKKWNGRGRVDIEEAIHELQLILELRYPE